MIQDPSEETIAGKAGTRACLTLVGLKLRQSLPCEAVHWPHVTLSVTARMAERSSRGSTWGLEPVRNTCSRKKNACSSHVLIVFSKCHMFKRTPYRHGLMIDMWQPRSQQTDVSIYRILIGQTHLWTILCNVGGNILSTRLDRGFRLDPSNNMIMMRRIATASSLLLLVVVVDIWGELLRLSNHV